MTLATIIDRVCRKLQKTDANAKANARLYARSRYEMLFQKRLWKESLLAYSVTTSAREIVFPEKVGQVLAARQDSIVLNPSSLMAEMRVSPVDFEAEGTAFRFVPIAPIGLNAVVDQEALSIEADASDTGTVTIVGEDENGALLKKTYTLTGTTPVVSDLPWETVHSFSRSGKATTLTVTGSPSGFALLTLEPGVASKKFQRVQLFQKPSEATSFSFLCKRAWDDLLDDSAEPIISAISLALEAYVMADMQEWLRQYGKAQAKFTEAMALEEVAASESVWQSAGIQQIVPEPSGVDYGGEDWFLP